MPLSEEYKENNANDIAVDAESNIVILEPAILSLPKISVRFIVAIDIMFFSSFIYISRHAF
jgi:hypothetical protein